jgi:hypothetical protein
VEHHRAVGVGHEHGVPVLGAGRIAALGHISGSEIDPAGNTSIGAGVAAGKLALDTAQLLGTPHYDVTALLVLTDGMENTPPMLIDVGSSITANTFAVGLGLPENISTMALNALTLGHSGYLLITGLLTSDQAARLNKYFLQVLAGITNANVILDPHGALTRGAVHRIPFRVAETEYGLDVFVLTPAPWLIDFELETPGGQRLTPASATLLTNLRYVQAGAMAYYRLSLPAIPADAGDSHAGTWHVVLTTAQRQPGLTQATDYVIGAVAGGATIGYDVVIHCYSNLLFNAQATQTSHEPGATVRVSASLREYDVPVDHRARVRAEVTRPDGSRFVLAMNEDDPGRFAGSFVANASGLYTIRVRALGASFAGVPFEREQTLSAAVFPGADRPPATGGGDTLWCHLVRCILAGHVIDGRLIARLRDAGFDFEALVKCLAVHCAAQRDQGKPR